MKIEKVEGLLIGSDLLGANYVVRITTDTGITGVGQSGAWGFPDATAEGRGAVHRLPHRPGPDAHRAHPAIPLPDAPVPRQHRVRRPLRHRHRALGHQGQALRRARLGPARRQGARQGPPAPVAPAPERQTPSRSFKSSREAAEEGFTALKFDPLRAGYQDQSLARLIEGAATWRRPRARRGPGRGPHLRAPPQAVADVRRRGRGRARRVPAAVHRGPHPDRLHHAPGRAGQALHVPPSRTASGSTPSGSSATCSRRAARSTSARTWASPAASRARRSRRSPSPTTRRS